MPTFSGLRSRLLAVAPLHRGATRGYDPVEAATFVAQLPQPEVVTVVASGPSAADLVRDDSHLYITTNGSTPLVCGCNYISFLTERSYVREHLKLGPRFSGWLGTIFRFETGSQEGRTTDTALEVLDYKQRFKRQQPELLATDAVSSGPWRSNFDYFQMGVYRLIGTEFKQFNSGFGALQVALCLSAAKRCPLHIYGLDAGEGGLVHFDGSPMASTSVSGIRVRQKLELLLLAIYRQQTVPVTNRSFFMPTERL